MPHPIMSYKRTKYTDHRTYIKDTVTSMMSDMHVVKSISYREVVSSVWDEATVKKVEEVMSIVHNDSNMQHSVSMMHMLTVKHPALPCPCDFTFSFWLDPPTDKPYLWPRELINGSANIESDAISEAMEEIVFSSVNRGLLRKVTDWLCENCTTHEQANWIFPFWEVICRKSRHLAQIGNAISECKRPPKLPAIPPDIRIALKFLHGFMAAQELLGTFDKGGTYREHNMCGLWLASGHRLTLMMGDLRTYWDVV